MKSIYFKKEQKKRKKEKKMDSMEKEKQLWNLKVEWERIGGWRRVEGGATMFKILMWNNQGINKILLKLW